MLAVLLSAALSMAIPQDQQEDFAWVDTRYEWCVHEDTWCKYISTAVYYNAIIMLTNEGIKGTPDGLCYYDELCIRVERTLELWCKRELIRMTIQADE